MPDLMAFQHSKGTLPPVETQNGKISFSNSGQRLNFSEFRKWEKPKKKR